MKKLISTLILLILGLGSHTAAGAVTFCDYSLTPRQLMTAADLDIRNVVMAPNGQLSIRFAGLIGGPRGGHLHIVERLGDNWATNWEFMPRAPLGDIRNLAIFLGPLGAKFFSFAKLNDKHIAVPDTKEFNSSLDELSRLLQKGHYARMELRFSHGEESVQPDEQLVLEFTRNFTLPMAHKGFMAAHDLSFHASSIFFEKLLRSAQKPYGRIADFAKFLRQSGQESFADRIFHMAAADIDTHTGNLVFVLEDLARGEDIEALNDLKISMKGLLYYDKVRTIDSMLDLFVISLIADARKLDSSFTLEKKDEILALLQQFKESTAGPEYSAPFVIDPDLTLEDIKNRLREIKIALATPP